MNRTTTRPAPRTWTCPRCHLHAAETTAVRFVCTPTCTCNGRLKATPMIPTEHQETKP